MTNTQALERKIEYYQHRLEFIRDFFLEGNKEILLENGDKISRLVQQYKKFPGYNHILAGFPETFLDIN